MENTEFWNELCGMTAFKALGLNEISEETIAEFDEWYFNTMYPYLYRYIKAEDLHNKNVLEIGLGFGTLGEYIFQHTSSYTGVDLAENPVKMLQQRIEWKNKTSTAKALIADATNLPFQNSSFDMVISIGCLHHTGNLPQSINEISRVLKNSGKAIIMLYNKNSYRRALLPFKYSIARLKRNLSLTYKEYYNSNYDTNTKGEAAPIIQYCSKKDIRIFFKEFRQISICTENFDLVRFMPRKLLLGSLGRLIGLDLYITVVK